MSQIEPEVERPLREPVTVGRVRVASASEAMADRLRAGILSGEIQQGTLLPTERDLAAESGLSRGSVREALKSLTLEGLLLSKVGRHGGYLVQQPPPDAIIRSLDVFIRGRGIAQNSLREVREIIEPMCAAMAAHRCSDEHLEQLRDLTTRMAGMTDDVPAFLDHNIEWHVAIAAASENVILASVMQAISTNIRGAISVDDYVSTDLMEAAQHLHEAVLRAIVERDPDAAHRRMRRHLHNAGDVVAREQSNGSLLPVTDVFLATAGVGIPNAD